MSVELIDGPDNAAAPDPVDTTHGANAPALTEAPDAARRARWQRLVAANRDQWGRPLIVPPKGGNPRGYRRASSFGAPLEDDTNLTKWKMRQVARGVTRSTALQAQVSRAELDLDADDVDTAKGAKRELDAITERAMDTVGSGDKATIGTALHHILERVDLGLDPGFVPEQLRADVKAYQRLVDGRFRALSVEEFVVEDEHQVAGTYDSVLELLRDEVMRDGTIIPAGTVVVGDKKTSQSMDFAGPKFACQCREYAYGQPYDPEQGKRIDWPHTPPSRQWAAILHIPSEHGHAQVYWVDLVAASEACAQSAVVRQWRGRRGKALITEGVGDQPPSPSLVERAQTATTVGALEALYFEARGANAWTDELLVACRDRKAELTAKASS